MAEDQSPAQTSSTAISTPKNDAPPSIGSPITDGMSTAQQVEAIATDQRNTLIEQWTSDKWNGGAFIACRDIKFMERSRCHDAKGNKVGQIVQLEGINTENAFVIIDASGKHELWARPDYSDYAGVFDKYTKRFYGVKWSSIASSDDWNVDHLYPRTAAELSTVKYVRLTAIDRKANQLMGATIESQMTKRTRESENPPTGTGQLKTDERRRPVLMATPFTIGKLTGFHDAIRLPKAKGDFADLAVTQRLAVHVATHCKFVEPDAISRLNEILTRGFATDIQTPLERRFEQRDRFANAHPEVFGVRRR